MSLQQALQKILPQWLQSVSDKNKRGETRTRGLHTGSDAVLGVSGNSIGISKWDRTRLLTTEKPSLHFVQLLTASSGCQTGRPKGPVAGEGEEGGYEGR